MSQHHSINRLIEKLMKRPKMLQNAKFKNKIVEFENILHFIKSTFKKGHFVVALYSKVNFTHYKYVLLVFSFFSFLLLIIYFEYFQLIISKSFLDNQSHVSYIYIKKKNQFIFKFFFFRICF